MQDASQRAMRVGAGLPRARGGNADGCEHGFVSYANRGPGDVRGKAPPNKTAKRQEEEKIQTGTTMQKKAKGR